MKAMGALSSWAELHPDELAPLTRAAPGEGESEGVDVDEEELIAYLRAGHVVVPVMESTRDVLGDAFTVAGGSALRTDGEWVWRTDLASYVEHYHLELPAPFVEHVRSSRGASADPTSEQLARIERELVARGPHWYRA